ncbi:MAG: hypothetical protein NTY37_02405 [Methanothrix sp.]|nr:hypothetical protein [Methanothrix sp.]
MVKSIDALCDVDGPKRYMKKLKGSFILRRLKYLPPWIVVEIRC